MEDEEDFEMEDGVGNGVPAAATSGRPWSFPEPKKEVASEPGHALDTWRICTKRHESHTSDGCDREKEFLAVAADVPKQQRLREAVAAWTPKP